MKARFFRLLIFLFAALCALGTLPSASAAERADAETLRIGWIEASFTDREREDVRATFDWLRQTLPQYRLEILSYSVKDLEKAITERKVDFFLGASGFYRRVFRHGLRDIATMTTALAPDPEFATGTAFLVLSDSPYRTLKDLKGLRAATSWKEGFTGVFIPMGEIEERGEDPEHFFKFTVIGSPALRLMEAVADGRADVAMARACSLELIAKDDPEFAGRFRVIGEKPVPPDFRCKSSTALYPAWTFVSTKEASWKASRDLTRSLLSMPPTADGTSWGVVSSFDRVDDLYRRLKAGPYSYLRVQSLHDFIVKNRTPIAFAVLLLIGLTLHSIRASQLVNRRTRELQAVMAKERAAQKEAQSARDAAEKLRRVSVIGAMSSLIAHEMNGPLGAISNTLEAMKRFNDREGLDERLVRMIDLIGSQCERAAAIVRKVRGYAKKNPRDIRPISLNKAVQKAVASRREKMPGIRLTENLPEKPVTVCWDELEAELATVNLLKNAAEALSECHAPDPSVIVTLEEDGHSAVITVSDNGTVSEEDLEKHSRPLSSSKNGGLGLGLLIVRTLAEGIGGHLELGRSDGRTLAKLVIPLAQGGTQEKSGAKTNDTQLKTSDSNS